MTGSVRDAVAKREAQVPAKVSPKQVAEQRIRGQLPTFSDVLPKDFDTDRFMRLTLVAIKDNEKLLRCFATPEGTQGLLLATIEAAMIGLDPNTPLEDAWIVPRRVKVGNNTWIDSAELQISYRGLSKLALRNAQVRKVSGEVIRQNDQLEYWDEAEGTHFVHRPAPLGQRGDIIGAWGRILLRDAPAELVVLDREAIDRARAASPSWQGGNNSPWHTDEASMARKTAIRSVCRRSPYQSVELARALVVDEHALAIKGEQIIAIEEAPEPALAIGGVVTREQATVIDETPDGIVIPGTVPEYLDTWAGDDVVAEPQVDPDTDELFAAAVDGEIVDIPPLGALRTRDDWAAWARLTGVKVTEIKPLTSWGDVANAPDDVRARIYAMGER